MNEKDTESGESKTPSDDTQVRVFSLSPATTALIMPSAKYLGSEIQKGVKTAVEYLKDKIQGENINKHREEAYKK